MSLNCLRLWVNPFRGSSTRGGIRHSAPSSGYFHLLREGINMRKGEGTSIGQELRDIRQRIKVLQGIALAYKSERANPTILEKQKEFHEGQIEWHKARISLLNERQSGNGQFVETAERNLSKARKTEKALKNNYAIQKMIRLYKEINKSMEDEQ